MKSGRNLVDIILEDFPSLGDPRTVGRGEDVNAFIAKTKLVPVISAYNSVLFENASAELQGDSFVLSGEGGALKKRLVIKGGEMLSSIVVLWPGLLFDMILNTWLKEEDPLYDYNDIPPMILDAGAEDAATDEDAVRGALKIFSESFRLDGTLAEKIMQVSLVGSGGGGAKAVRADFSYGALGVNMSVTADVKHDGRDALAKYAALVLAAGYNDFLVCEDVKASLCVRTLEEEGSLKVSQIMTNGDGFAVSVTREDGGAAVTFIPAYDLSAEKLKSETQKAAGSLRFTAPDAASVGFLYALIKSSAPDDKAAADIENFAMNDRDKVIWGVREELSKYLNDE